MRIKPIEKFEGWALEREDGAIIASHMDHGRDMGETDAKMLAYRWNAFEGHTNTGKHLPEPWQAKGRAIYSQQHIEVTFISEGKGNELDEANAARIVECVNACAGLTTDELRRLPAYINEGTAALMERDVLIEQRDALLRALEEIKPFVDNDFPPHVQLGKRSDAYTAAWHRMNSTIDLVKGVQS